MRDGEHYARLLRAFHGGLIAGPDVYVFCGQLLRKLSKGSGHVRKSGVKHEFLVAGNSVTFQRLLGLGPVVYHELYVTHGCPYGKLGWLTISEISRAQRQYPGSNLRGERPSTKNLVGTTKKSTEAKSFA